MLLGSSPGIYKERTLQGYGVAGMESVTHTQSSAQSHMLEE